MSLLDTSGGTERDERIEDGTDLDVAPAAGDHEPAPPRPVDDRAARRLVDAVVVAASALFVFWQLHPDLLLAETTPAGGDMGAHVWAFAYLRDHLLPDLRLAGWTPDWYAGFPAFHFYMVVPFLGMVALNAGVGGVAMVLPAAASLLLAARAAGASLTDRHVQVTVAGLAAFALVVGAVAGFGPELALTLIVAGVGCGVAAGLLGRGSHRLPFALAAVAVALLGVSVPYGPSFKLVTVAGVVAMPASAYLFGRLARFPHPTPALLAVATLGFLFDKSFTIYGGNVASTMAGEFAFSISLALAIAYLGVLVHGLRTGTHRATAAVLLALVGLCHLIPAFFAVGATVVLLVVHVAAEPAREGLAARRTNAVAGAAAVVVAAGTALALALDLATVGPVLAVGGVLLVIVAIVALTRRGTEVDGDDDHGPIGVRRVWWLAGTGVVAALLAAWWVLPFYGRRTYLNDMGWEKIAVHREGTAIWTWFSDEIWPALVPGDLRLFAALALVGAVLSLAFRHRVGTSLVVMGLGLALAFVFLPQGRLWNARLLPFWYLVVYFLAAIGVGEIVRALAQVLAADPRRPRRLVALVAAPLALLLLGGFLAGQLRNVPGGATNADGSYRLVRSVGVPGLFSVDVPEALAVDIGGRNFVTDWARWNYSGYERKDAYPEYRGIVDTMARVGETNGCGRSLWEYSPDLNDYGTPMALMLLPHWTDGCIGSMEGLYFEASSTTPFHFLMQSELSQQPSRAQRDMPYRELDVDAGVEHLQLMGVRYYLARSPEAKAAAGANPELRQIASDGPWVVYEVADVQLVEALAFEPAVTTADQSQPEWLGCTEGEPPCPGVALEWFQDPSRWDVALAADGPDGWQRLDPGDSPEVRPVTPAVVSDVEHGDGSVSFTVDRPGTPVLVKTSYFPSWRASGAEGPYRVAPNLMVVVPTDTEVELRYARTGLDWAAIALTLLGVAGALALSRRPPLRLRPLADDVS
ncbi:MAG TPA: hypothetical protein VFU14_10665 [Acidimicrobiales bacterium]|nr:hypothetical protein [Acidimicrobiales bacterium]